MENVLGLILFGVFIVCTIALAAGATWLVVRISPTPKSGKKAEPEPTPTS